MTPEDAYEMGFRHVADLSEICRIAEMIDDDAFADYALKLMEAWRAGAMAARAVVERELATIQ
ncbi:MAG: hypothetical protein H6905_03830 [Hyphomicrobiales bacterium]|nr:hypothetical protein [Hyphomicrobiales bacterium]